MGGASGHLQHLLENRSLKVSDLKSILIRLFNGTLEGASEKIDGMSLVFTWNDELKAARKYSDIPSGGMDAASLAARFAGRGNVELAFNEGFAALEACIGTMTPEERTVVFGTGGERWYSIELVHQQALNTIKYDGNHIVFHRWPVFQRSMIGKVEKLNVPMGIDVIVNAIPRMQLAARAHGFEVHGPADVTLVPSSSENTMTLERSLHWIDGSLKELNLSDNVTLHQYLCLRSLNSCSLPNQSPTALGEYARKMADAPDALNANEIKKLFSGPARDLVTQNMRERESWQEQWLIPFEKAVYDIETLVLGNVQSAFVVDGNLEVTRLQSTVASTYYELMASSDEDVKDQVQRHFSKLGSVARITSSMEGIVFVFNDEPYKITGAFAHAHQILALKKYGSRCGRKKIDERKHVQQRVTNYIRRA